jgi:SynChlorMet cassette radical SAM/SPASM protein ScmE
MTAKNLIQTPREIHVAITGRCNLNCSYCFYADEMTGRKDLSTQTWLDFFDSLGKLGVMRVILTGGEVFLRPDIFEIIDNVISNHMRYSILSNGTLIDENIVKLFTDGKRLLRLNTIQISIDGSIPEIHDQSRPHSFDHAIKGLRLFKEAHMPITTRVTINRHNYRDLENIAKLLLEDVALPSFSTNEAFPCGATNRYEPDFTLTPEQRIEVLNILNLLVNRYPNRINSTAGPLSLLQQDKKIKNALAEGFTALPGCGYLSACNGVFYSLAILHDGTITPCHILSDLVLGNIITDDIIDIWQNHPTLQSLRNRKTISLDEIEPCKNCAYKGFCTGGCPGGALFFNKNTDTRNPMDCFRILMGEEIFFTKLSENSGNKPGE